MKQYPPLLVQQARDLRVQGLTYREINNYLHLSIPKPTFSGWFHNLPLPSFYRNKVQQIVNANLQKVRPIALANNKQILHRHLEQIRNKNTGLVNLVDRPIGILLLSTLYWCEGGKYPARSSLQFGNSDPKMIKLFLTLLRTCYCLDESKFRLTIQHRADQDSGYLTRYWAGITNIPLSQHYACYVDARSIGKPTHKTNYHGVCVIHYFDTDRQCELQFTGELLGSDPNIKIMKKQII
jgi:hypothetical protein